MHAHSYSCPFPEGCNCGATVANHRETFLAQQAKLVADQGAELLKCRELLGRWLKVYTDAMEEAREIGNSDYNITAGLVCDTRSAIDPKA
jgi:hypothetical protein